MKPSSNLKRLYYNFLTNLPLKSFLHAKQVRLVRRTMFDTVFDEKRAIDKQVKLKWYKEARNHLSRLGYERYCDLKLIINEDDLRLMISTSVVDRDLHIQSGIVEKANRFCAAAMVIALIFEFCILVLYTFKAVNETTFFLGSIFGLMSLAATWITTKPLYDLIIKAMKLRAQHAHHFA